jgi:ferrous iron transport protein A
MAKSLNNSRNGEKVRIAAIGGDARFMSRITAIGLTIGCEVEIIENHERLPILIYERDTMVAVNRNDSEWVMVEDIR